MSIDKSRIQKILNDGIKENLSPDQIVDRILADTTQYKKKHDVSIQEFEELLRESKRLIQESRKLLYKSVSGA